MAFKIQMLNGADFNTLLILPLNKVRFTSIARPKRQDDTLTRQERIA